MSFMDKLFKRNNDVEKDDGPDDFVFAENAESEEDKKNHKRRDFLNKYKLGNHHKIERFGMTVVSGLVVLLLISGFSFIRSTSNKNVQLDTKAIYSQTLTYSLSENEGSVESVTRSEDGKSAYVLFKMDDLTNVSLDASTYTVYLTGYNKALQFNPAGSIFIFGSTGYMGVMLHDDGGIPNQVLDITIRANVDIRSDATNSSTISDDVDGSFAKYDQAQVYVNFGAKQATVNKVLNNNDIEPSDLYYELVSKSKDKELHEELNTAYDDLARLITRSTEYETRIQSAGYVVPDEPEWLDDDYVVPGGIDINKDKTLSDGYISQVLSDYSQFSEYMVNKNKENTASQIDTSATSVTELTSTTGGVLDLNEISDGVSSSVDLSVKADVETLTSTWTSILSQKQKIQTDINKRLVLLDAEQQDQNTVFSLGDTDQLILW